MNFVLFRTCSMTCRFLFKRKLQSFVLGCFFLYTHYHSVSSVLSVLQCCIGFSFHYQFRLSFNVLSRYPRVISFFFFLTPHVTHHLIQFSPVLVHGDNFNANNLASNTAHSARTRHIALRERFVTEKVLDGLIKILKIDTSEQLADIFTKPVRKDILRKHSVSLGLDLPQHALVCMVCSMGFGSNNLLHKHIREAHDTSILKPERVSNSSSFWPFFRRNV